MKNTTSDLTLVENLTYAAGKYQLGLEQAEKALQEAQDNRDRCADRLAKAQALLEHERERIGMKQLTLDDKGPYADLTFKEAVLRVLEKKNGQPVSAEDIYEQLRANGYLADSKYPGRALHAALIGVDEVERVERGTYRWIEGIGGGDMPNLVGQAATRDNRRSGRA